jgi:mannitol/fructose-specific phosphotransferase system IIA component (Ntr-type)
VIQYNLNAIELWLKSNHARIIRHSGVGLRLELTAQQRSEIMRELAGLDNIELVLSTRQRRRSLMLKLLSMGEPVSSGALAAEFQVSRTTAMHDLVQVRLWLEKYRLQLSRTGHKGFYIEGRSYLKRFAMCALYCEEHFEDQIPSGVRRLISSRLPFDYLGSEWFRGSDMEFARQTTRKVELALRVQYSQAAEVFLHYYLMLLLGDMRRGQQMVEQVAKEGRRFREIAALPEVKQALEGYAAIKVTEAEMQLLALHLHCQSAFQTAETDEEQVSAQEASRLGTALVKEISLFLHPYLQLDPVFNADIVRYLDRCLPYRRVGFAIPNMHQEQAREACGGTYETIQRICSRQEKLVNNPLTENDISALSVITSNALERIPQITQRNIRVALISHTDEALTHYTRARILEKFAWVRIAGVFREFDPHRLRAHNIDLILSTRELAEQAHPEAIVIDPFVTEADVEHIRNWIDQNVVQKSSALRSREKPGLQDILLRRNITIRSKVRDWEEAVYAVGDPLVHNGDLGRGYLDAIIRVQKTYGPYSVVSPHIALLHAKPTDGVMNLCVGLMIVKDGVAFGATSFDPVHLVFILGITDLHSHLNALKELAGMIRTRTVYEGLRRCGSVDDAVQFLHANPVNQ